MPVSWLPRPARSYLHNRIFLSRYKVAAFLRRRPGKSQYSWYFLRGRDLIFRNSVTGANPEIFSKNFYLNSVMEFCHGRHENARELFKKNFIMNYTVRPTRSKQSTTKLEKRSALYVPTDSRSVVHATAACSSSAQRVETTDSVAACELKAQKETPQGQDGRQGENPGNRELSIHIRQAWSATAVSTADCRGTPCALDEVCAPHASHANHAPDRPSVRPMPTPSQAAPSGHPCRMRPRPAQGRMGCHKLQTLQQPGRGPIRVPPPHHPRRSGGRRARPAGATRSAPAADRQYPAGRPPSIRRVR